MLPEPPHVGEPTGIYLFDRTGEALVRRARSVSQAATLRFGTRLLTADLDAPGGRCSSCSRTTTSAIGAGSRRWRGGRRAGCPRPSVMLASVDPARALHHADQAIARDGAPELVRERLSRHRAMAELTARDPAWRQSLAPR
ncbi:hypothetical protein OV203_38095 [Nannocystis sp. ILAH1]|uniref:hypothetical protein n=1 Tax=unclassified Nannocystis TaxID=2627009 RepID=UPI00226E42EF|nr:MULTISPECIES: hypothetical protein [unclassified Nannocystis]MCY0993016.1 hypothetical protein [Nannocystis sp. ILAH1]MCY1066150.1 hypothetical protein [Nannocystis sp. RBIL2]